ncbi:hypothetical protein PIB30_096218, partial [Stylosanthes scabra]|nr:hypothetical protein [Stylosanthes scabra]
MDQQLLAQEAPTPRPTPRRALGSLGVALTFPNQVQSPRISVEDQAYAWKQAKQLTSTLESTHRRGSPCLCVEITNPAQSQVKSKPSQVKFLGKIVISLR